MNNQTTLKIVKYFVIFLIAVAILLEINAIRITYSVLNIEKTQIPIPSNIFLLMLLGVLLFPIIYVIAYLISIFLIIKDRKTGYLISIVISFLILSDGMNQIMKNHIKITFTTGLTIIFWIALIIISSISYRKLAINKK